MSISPSSKRLRSVLAANRTELESVCRLYGATEVKVFGSVARGDANPDSDIDVLVDLQGPAHQQLMSMLGLGEELSELLGLRVDVLARGIARDDLATSVAAEMVDV